MKAFSRRSFLKGLGIGTLASAPPIAKLAAAAPSENSTASPAPDATTLGPGETEFALNINGQVRALRVEPRVTLLDVLRNRLDLTAAKEVCDRGTCGACTVHLDGQPVYACMVLAVDAVGRKITTAEGLAKTPGQLDPVQRAFVENDALMCGFCTPGFVMSARALLDKNPHPNREEIVRACAGNLCRCGAYPHIVKAIEKASRGEVA